LKANAQRSRLAILLWTCVQVSGGLRTSCGLLALASGIKATYDLM
jgi:hypothetical protein